MAHPGETTQETTQLRSTLARLRSKRCADCSRELCDHHLLCAIALGLKDAPRCPECAAVGLSRPLDQMKRDLGRWLGGKDCFSRVWTEADPSRCPSPCTWASLIQPRIEGDDEETDEDPLSRAHDLSQPELVLDFGDLACGELVLQLRQKMRSLAPGTVVRVIATDPGAPEDIPSWTRLAGHTLLRAEPPHYDLKRRTD